MQYNIESYIAEKEARERIPPEYDSAGDSRHYGSVAIESGAIRERKQDSYACSTGKICKRPGKAYRHKNL